METIKKTRSSSIRWGILRRALLRNRNSHISDKQSQVEIESISRKTKHGFNLIPCQLLLDNNNINKQESQSDSRDCCMCYTLPIHGSPKLYLYQRTNSHADLNDFEICNRYRIDNTGLVCSWPLEDVLAYFRMSNADMFRSKRVLELGSGYGLAGLVVAATTEAVEVVISDGNPQVVDYIQHNIEANTGLFGDTNMKSMMLHWNQTEISNISNTFDVIIASDCTFFDEFHKDLVRITELLLRSTSPSEAIFFSPKRGDSLDKFVKEVEGRGLQYSLVENYNELVWKHHQKFMNGNELWANYEKRSLLPITN
ncbi:calmodulin-lysine N-methyltransferase-like [Rutidosis leptorrhynchoides]|uniref:calmodulin-lysine N-methyltransferase-like n=1 Tax=Rutidosis leptorrhynchoides TaxID=125765 RepID=UPI003A9A6537